MLYSTLLYAFSVISAAHCASIVPPSSQYGTLKFKQSGNVTTATFDNPPINLLDTHLISDFYDFLNWLQPAPGRTTPKVVVFDSANPEFFLAHTDLRFLEGDAVLPGASQSIAKLLQVAHLLVNTTSTTFIARIDGRATGAGNELALQMDMRFAGPHAFAVQFEDSIGLSAAGGGNLFMTYLIGRAKAIEHIQAALPFDCRLGKETGLFNDCYEDAGTLEAAVDVLAARIALFPQYSLNNTKVTLNGFYPTRKQQQDDLDRLFPLTALPAEKAIIKELISLSGNQTETQFELNIPASILKALYGYTATGPTTY